MQWLYFIIFKPAIFAKFNFNHTKNYSKTRNFYLLRYANCKIFSTNFYLKKINTATLNSALDNRFECKKNKTIMFFVTNLFCYERNKILKVNVFQNFIFDYAKKIRHRRYELKSIFQFHFFSKWIMKKLINHSYVHSHRRLTTYCVLKYSYYRLRNNKFLSNTLRFKTH